VAFQAIFNESSTDGFFEEIGPGLHPLRMVGRNRICLRGDDERTVVVWGGPNLAELGGGSYRVTGLRSIPAGGSIRIDLGVQNTYTGAKREPENIRLNGLLVGALQPKMFLSRGELRFESFAGLSYQLQISVDLQKWEDSGEPIDGTGGEMAISDFPNAEKQRQFYRVKLLQ